MKSLTPKESYLCPKDTLVSGHEVTPICPSGPTKSDIADVHMSGLPD